MADEHDILDLFSKLCRLERDAVLIQLEAEDPALAERVRQKLEKEQPSQR